MRLPTFIGIGAPKAGTTWLFRCLREHPAIFAAAVKETNFFDYATIAGRMPEYAAHFAAAAGCEAVGEISTRYLTSCRAPLRIQTWLPKARLFVTVRNPVEQIYSHYWHLRRQNFHQGNRRNVPRSFEEALNTYESRLFEPALYAKHIERWLHYFDPSQLLIIFYDDIRDRPRDVLRNLYAFLGADEMFIPPSIAVRGATVRRGASPRNPLCGHLYSVLYDHLSHRLYYRCKQLIGSRRALHIKERLPVSQLMEQLFLRPGYPAMSPQTRTDLRTRFAADIQHLERLSGRDLSHWKSEHDAAA